MKKFRYNLAFHKSIAVFKLQTVFLISMTTPFRFRQESASLIQTFFAISADFCCFQTKARNHGVLKKAYLAYFIVKLSHQDKNWTPLEVCWTCVEM